MAKSGPSIPVRSTTPLSTPPPAIMLAAFRHPNFLAYFIGQLVSTSGTWMQTVAQGVLVFQLTKSELWLGIVACAAGLPALFLSPFGGVVVERFPRQRILLVTQAAQMILAFTLAGLVFTQVVQVWHVVILALLIGMVNAIDAPARQSFIIDMVGREDLQSGIATNSLMFNLSRVIGPTAAGLVLFRVGPAWCFFLNGASFLAVLISLLIIRIDVVRNQVAVAQPLRQLREGLRFVRQHVTIGPILLLATGTNLFATNATTLFPAFAGKVLNSPDQAYAALVTANGIGAVIAAATVTWSGQRFGRGKLVGAAALLSSIMVGLIAISADPTHPANLLPVLFFSLLYGLCLITQFVTMNTLIQLEVPNEYRGRVLSLYTLAFFGLAPFGALFLGLAAQQFGTVATLIGCAALGLIATLAVLIRAPELRDLP